MTVVVSGMLIIQCRRRKHKQLHILEVEDQMRGTGEHLVPGPPDEQSSVVKAGPPPSDFCPPVEWSGTIYMVKEYVRAGAGHLVPDPEDLRPPDVLRDALHYLITE